MKRTLFLIHHSHTDVGYTEPQGRIERWQVDFIRQALAIVGDLHDPDNRAWPEKRDLCS